jgi:hypothetical protein
MSFAGEPFQVRGWRFEHSFEVLGCVLEDAGIAWRLECCWVPNIVFGRWKNVLADSRRFNFHGDAGEFFETRDENMEPIGERRRTRNASGAMGTSGGLRPMSIALSPH